MARCSIALLVTLAAGCTGQQDDRTPNEIPLDAPAVPMRSVYVARLPDSTARVNGAAMYHGPDGAHWLIATMSNDALAVFDAATGTLIRTVGTSGVALGELRGPQGIVVLGDSIALVVERDNGRVQGFHLPDFTTIGTFGDRLIGPPIAIAAALTGNAYAVYVASEAVGKFARVGQFRLTVGNGELIAIHWRTFGDSAGSGTLQSPQSIAVDAAYKRVLIADGTSPESAIKVYDTDGRFTRVLAARAGDVGGIALFACANDRGYWITAAAGDSVDAIQMFDRASMAHAGSFADSSGRIGSGLATSGHGYGRFPRGAVFVVRRDASVAAFSWRDIAAALHSEADCANN